MDPRLFWLAGRAASGDGELTVTHPYDGRSIGSVSVPRPDQVEEAVGAAHAVRHEAAALPLHVRAAALDHVSRRLAERADEIARLITGENGKPLMWARAEVSRAVSTFRFAAEGPSPQTVVPRPPSTGMTAPVTYDPARLAR